MQFSLRESEASNLFIGLVLSVVLSLTVRTRKELRLYLTKRRKAIINERSKKKKKDKRLRYKNNLQLKRKPKTLLCSRILKI